MKRFEYKELTYETFLSTKDRTDTLNKLGSEGWELIAVYRGMYVFKRELPDSNITQL